MENEGEIQENDDSYQRPLSPILTHSNRSFYLSKRKRMRSRVKLANRFSKDKENENTSKESVSIVSNESLNLSQEAEFIESLKIFEKIEDEQCIIQIVPPLLEEDNNANFKKPSSPAPVARKIKQAQELESTKFKGFQTAAGKNIQISSSVSQSQALFDDILNPLKTQESRCNRYSFLSKIKPKDKINLNLTDNKTKNDLLNLNKREISNTENIQTKNISVGDKFKTCDNLDCDSMSNIPKQHKDENLYTSFLNSEETDQLFSNITLIENQVIKKQVSNVPSEDIKLNEEFKGFDEKSIEESNRIAVTMVNQLRITHKKYQTCSERLSQEVCNDISERKRFKSDSVMSTTSSSSLKLKSVPHKSITIKQSYKKNLNKEKIETISSKEGFQFASGNPVFFSQKALEQAASKLLDNMENIAIHNSKSSVFLNSSESITESSFKRDTKISKRNDLSCTPSSDFDKLALSGGFQFASGNSVYLSEEALEIASAKLLADAENLAVNCKLKTLNRIDKIFNKTDKFNKRSGASNDEISTPNKILKSAENVLEEVAAQLLESEENKTLDNSSSFECITQTLNRYSEITAASKGFQLASGKSVNVSDDALKRASVKLSEAVENKLKSSTDIKETDNVFKKIDLDTEESSTISLDTPNGGFQLASGNAVYLSEKALKTAKDLLKNEENVTLQDKSSSSTGFPGFLNNTTQSSSKAVKEVFKGIDLGPELFNPSLNNFNKVNKGRNKSEGLLFAPGNAVQRTKEIFKGIDLSPELFNPSLNKFTKIKKGHNSSEGFLFAPEKAAVKVFENEKNIVQDNSSIDCTGCPKSTNQASAHRTDLNIEVSVSQTLFHDARIKKSVDGFQTTASKSSIQLLDNALMRDTDMLKNEDDVKQYLTAFSGLSDKSFKTDNEQPNYKDAEPSTSRSSIDALKDNTDISQEISLTERGKLNTSRRKLNQRKRLGTTPCKPMYISSNKLEKCKLFFEDDKSLSHSPSKSNEPLIFNSTPSKHFSSIPPEPDITPIKNINDTTALEQEQGNFLDNRVIIQECTKGDVKAWTESLESERFRLEMKIKVILMREEALNRQKYVLQNSTPDYRRRRTGVLFNKKEIGKEFQLKNFVKLNRLQHHLSYITPQNAERVHFNYAEENVPYINTTDGASVIPNVKDLVGLSEIEMAFKTMPGIEPRLIPTGWIGNHFKWIVWKLASYERYASNFQGALTLENVIQQLKYRYDREIDKAERSALRKILEKDDVPQKRIVLCVSNVFNVAVGKFELELTDGWYSIRTVIDQPLCAQVSLQKIKIGTKLIICGAELLNCDGCHPLEATDMVRLKICYNSTRRALWHAKLGYQRFVEPFPLTLSSFSPDGGIVGCVKVYIARIYPVKYLEKQNNLTVWRNKKAEEIRAQNWENERSNQIEEIREIVRKDCERSQNKKQHVDTNLSDSDIKNINCPETLYNLYQKSRDPESLHEMLSKSQIDSIMEHQRRSSFTLQQEISRGVEERVTKLQLPQRDVTPMQQMLVIDTLDPQEKRSVLQIWRPLEAHVQLLKESAVFYVYNVSPKKNGLSSTNRTKFQAVTGEFPKFDKYKRILTPISVLNSSVNGPMFNEFDTVGIVVQVSVNNFEQGLWLTDVCGSLLFVKVFEGPKNCSLLDSTKSGQLVAVSNLVSKDSKFEFAEAIANHSTTVSCYPKQKHLQEGINKFNEQFSEDLKSFLADCNQRITHYIDKINLSRACNSRSSSFVQSNTLNSCQDFDESCEETTLTQSRITSTDVALSLIDIDTIASNNN